MHPCIQASMHPCIHPSIHPSILPFHSIPFHPYIYDCPKALFGLPEFTETCAVQFRVLIIFRWILNPLLGHMRDSTPKKELHSATLHQEATRNKCIASGNKCLTSSNKCLTSSNKDQWKLFLFDRCPPPKLQRQLQVDTASTSFIHVLEVAVEFQEHLTNRYKQ